MSIFKIPIAVCNPQSAGRMTILLEAVVDTGSELTWLPVERLRSIGVRPGHKQLLPGPHGAPLERHTGYLILHANWRQTTDDVVFAEPGDPIVIGARTMQGLGVAFDDLPSRFISLETMKAFGRPWVPAFKTPCARPELWEAEEVYLTGSAL